MGNTSASRRKDDSSQTSADRSTSRQRSKPSSGTSSGSSGSGNRRSRKTPTVTPAPASRPKTPSTPPAPPTPPPKEPPVPAPPPEPVVQLCPDVAGFLDDDKSLDLTQQACGEASKKTESIPDLVVPAATPANGVSATSQRQNSVSGGNIQDIAKSIMVKFAKDNAEPEPEA